MRLLLKTLGYRILAAAVIFLLTGSWAVVILSEAIKFPMYALYDYLWERGGKNEK